MALSDLSEWGNNNGTSCGAGDNPSACGASAPEEKPAACGSACGAGDK